MSLTKGQKSHRNAEVVEAGVVTNPTRIRELWKNHDWNKGVLLRRPEIWPLVKELALKANFEQKQGDYKIILENSALSDAELVELGVAENEPLRVVEHPNCGNETLMVVAICWHWPPRRDMNMDALPNWATPEQFERMGKLYPRSKVWNATIGYHNFLLGPGAKPTPRHLFDGEHPLEKASWKMRGWSNDIDVADIFDDLIEEGEE